MNKQAKKPIKTVRQPRQDRLLDPSMETEAGRHLCRAAMDGNLEGLQRLAAEGASLDSKAADDFGNRMPALLWAISFGQPEAALFLLRHGAGANLRDDQGRTPLMAAVGRDHLELIQALVDAGGDLQAANGQGTTVLMEAAASGQPEVVRLLLNHGADLHARDQAGLTALLHATGLRGDSCDAVRLLLERGANPNDQDPVQGRSALMRAAWGGSLDTVKLLLEHGADPMAKDRQGKTVLELLETPAYRYVSPAIKAYLKDKASAPS